MEFISAIDFVDAVISEACEQGASDIHLHPDEHFLIVRFRVNGLLIDISTLHIKLHPEILARIKILASLRIDEHLMPQDGRFRSIFPNGKSVDIRVSLTPTQHGEQIVLRVLQNSNNLQSLEDLGMDATHQEKIKNMLDQRKGLLLVTGPTGSGKTSTLYSLLRMLNTRDTSIVTIEDPIEYVLEGVTQIAVNLATGLSFASILRSVMRQDPDIIMIGEIRDRETAELAIQASLTGHMVLSTLHTVDSPTAVLRLIDMGIEPYLVASTLELVIAQRLVPKKSGTGRIGIFELLHLESFVREAITKDISRHTLLSNTTPDTYSPLSNDCVKKVMQNIVDRDVVRKFL